ncbi:MAG: glycosyltransferase family 39 protein [Anaerolineae bacterium]|nr:glycosyltransferase family 39 protein [Anaerolineae bacterium]
MPDRVHWSWIVPLLLLAAALSGSLLDVRAFNFDEASTLLRTGGHHSEPFNLEEIQQAILEKSPDQAFGWSFLIAVWGRVFGWSEVALRSLSWFAGLLALAWIWRSGRDMFGATAGLVATSLLATSLLFVTYMAIARTYTLVVLFALMAFHGYWRAALRAGGASRSARLMLLTGAAGLLYTHYFGALLVLALGLFHMVMVRPDRRWLQPLAPFLLAGLVFLPQLQFMLRGIAFNEAALGSDLAMAPHVALMRIVEVYSNDLVHLLPKIAAALFVLAGLLTLRVAWQRRGARRTPDATLLLVCVTLALTALILIANEVTAVLLPERARYAFALWPLFSLTLGLGFQHARQVNRATIPFETGLLALLLITGLVGNLHSGLRDRHIHHYSPAPIHLALRDLKPHWTSGDHLVVDRTLPYDMRTIWVYTYPFADSRTILETVESDGCDDACLTATLQDLQQHENVWLLFANPGGDLQTRLQQALLSAGMSLCRSIDYRQRQALTLIHLARSETDCA